MVACHIQSWNVLLHDITHSDTVEHLVALYISDKTDKIKNAFCVAAAQLLIETYQHDQWIRVARERRGLIGQHDLKYKLDDRYNYDIQDVAHHFAVNWYEEVAKSPLTKAIKSYLQTGDKVFLDILSTRGS